MNRGVWWIGLFKLTKSVLLLTLAIGALSVLHKDVQEIVTYRIWQLGADPENKFVKHFIDMLGVTSPHKVALVSAASFFYSALFGVEGVGLLMRKRWAEYLTVIVTASFLPLEFYELSKHFTVFKTGVVALNIAIVIYLIVQLRKPKEERSGKQ